MTITAKYAAICPVCNGPINPGSQIEWSKGTKARHTACSSSSSSPAVAPRTYGQRIEAQRSTTARRRGWGAGAGGAARVPGYSSFCTDNASCRCFDCAS